MLLLAMFDIKSSMQHSGIIYPNGVHISTIRAPTHDRMCFFNSFSKLLECFSKVSILDMLLRTHMVYLGMKGTV